MVKNTMELARKLKRHHQGVKLTKRQAIIKIQDLESNQPDFSLGTYMIKPNSEYTLLFRIDLPKETVLWIDFWGINPKLQHLLQARIVGGGNKDIRQRFHSYPKTKYFFATFRVEQLKDIPSPMTYIIHYFYLEGKNPLPKGVVTPDIPVIKYPSSIELDIECHPKSLLEMDLKDPLHEFELPINMKIFEESVLSYLLKRESGPHYIEALLKNINFCQVHLDLIYSSQWELVDTNKFQEDLIHLRNQISEKYTELEDLLTKIDRLIEAKHSLENLIDQPDANGHQSSKYEQQIDVFEKTLETLNLKRNHLKKLLELNRGRSSNLLEQDKENINEILNYYDSRVLEDHRIIQSDLNDIQKQWKSFQAQIILPKENRAHQQKERLDEILENYRQLQEKALLKKYDLDELTSKFVLIWYQWIQKLNIEGSSKN